MARKRSRGVRGRYPDSQPCARSVSAPPPFRARERTYLIEIHVPPAEPTHLAWLLLAAGLLVATSVLFTRYSSARGVPVLLLFLLVGVAAGAAGVGGSARNHPMLFRVGTVALVVILFDGGLGLEFAPVRRVLAPSLALATFGVVGTAAVVAAFAHRLGLSWTVACLLGAMVSPTDAAAVFTELRASGVRLRRRLGATLELESGLNDPVATVLTFALTASVVGARPVGAHVLLGIVWQLAIGAACGVALGRLGSALLRRAQLPAGGLYPVLTLSLALVAYGLTSVLEGSGFLAVFVAGVVLGNGPLPYGAALVRSHHAFAWVAQVLTFVLFGMAAPPARLAHVALPGVACGLLLALVARPAAVALCLLPFRYRAREIACVAWFGLRGAVPMILAAWPVLAGAPAAEQLFDLVLMVVIVNSFVPGALTRPVIAALGVESEGPPPPPASLELSSMQVLRSRVMSFYIDRSSAACGATVAELPLPAEAAAVLVTRGDELIAPRAETRLLAGDHVFVVCRPEDQPFVALVFGRLEED
jgi:cell volume regulation protein A